MLQEVSRCYQWISKNFRGVLDFLVLRRSQGCSQFMIFYVSFGALQGVSELFQRVSKSVSGGFRSISMGRMGMFGAF